MTDEEAKHLFFSDDPRKDSLSLEEMAAVNDYCVRVLGASWHRYVVRREVEAMGWPEELSEPAAPSSGERG